MLAGTYPTRTQKDRRVVRIEVNDGISNRCYSLDLYRHMKRYSGFVCVHWDLGHQAAFATFESEHQTRAAIATKRKTRIGNQLYARDLTFHLNGLSGRLHCKAKHGGTCCLGHGHERMFLKPSALRGHMDKYSKDEDEYIRGIQETDPASVTALVEERKAALRTLKEMEAAGYDDEAYRWYGLDEESGGFVEEAGQDVDERGGYI
ncbi:hypothetical protein HDU96_001159 [Phlyctochytrium bullatum]|nr:hypothetical protein HDU96_001159 [Phlyctochytrium bullatum]